MDERFGIDNSILAAHYALYCITIMPARRHFFFTIKLLYQVQQQKNLYTLCDFVISFTHQRLILVNFLHEYGILRKNRRKSFIGVVHRAL